MDTQKAHIIVSQTDSGYYIVDVKRRSEAITLRSYKSTEALDARRFADTLAELLHCSWQDKRSSKCYP